VTLTLNFRTQNESRPGFLVIITCIKLCDPICNCFEFLPVREKIHVRSFIEETADSI